MGLWWRAGALFKRMGGWLVLVVFDGAEDGSELWVC